MTPLWTLFKGDFGMVKSATVYVSAAGNLLLAASLPPGSTAKNLTGDTATLKVWKADTAATLISKAITVSDAANGVVQWTVTSADAAALPVDLDGYPVEVQLAAGGYQETADTATVVVRPAA